MFKCGKLCNATSKLEDMIAQSKLSELLHKKEEPVKEKKNGIVIALAIIGSVAAVATIAYFVYKWMNPDYLEEFDDYDEEDEKEDKVEGCKSE